MKDAKLEGQGQYNNTGDGNQKDKKRIYSFFYGAVGDQFLFSDL